MSLFLQGCNHANQVIINPPMKLKIFKCQRPSSHIRFKVLLVVCNKDHSNAETHVFIYNWVKTCSSSFAKLLFYPSGRVPEGNGVLLWCWNQFRSACPSRVPSIKSQRIKEFGNGHEPSHIHVQPECTCLRPFTLQRICCVEKPLFCFSTIIYTI